MSAPPRSCFVAAQSLICHMSSPILFFDRHAVLWYEDGDAAIFSMPTPLQHSLQVLCSCLRVLL